MKLSLIALITLTALSSHAQISPTNCLQEARDWIFRNTSANSSQAGEQAMRFCSNAGRASCLEDAKAWIFRNTSSNSSESGLRAIEFCMGGNVSCLEPTKDWVFKNTSANSSQAAAKALEICKGSSKCETTPNPPRF